MTTPRQCFTDLNGLALRLELGGFSSEVLYWGLYDGSMWWRNYLHVHSFFEICYVFKGKGEFWLHEKMQQVNKGDMFIARPNERHEIISSKENPLGIYFWSYTLVPPAQIKTTELGKLFQAFQKSQQSILVKQQGIARILELLSEEICHKSVGYAFVIEGLVKQLLIEVGRAATDLNLPNHFPLHAQQDRVVDTILRYLGDNYVQPLNLRAIAAQVHLSERHMSRLFKASTGQSIKQYLTQLKMDVAKQLLLDKRYSVSEVAYETGYEDVRHFSTVFRQQTGSSPSQYRERGGTHFID